MLRPIGTRAIGAGDARRGSALVIALVTSVLVLGLCLSYLTVSSGLSRRMRSTVESTQALQLAEAGLAEAYVGLSIMKTGSVGSQAQPVAFGDGLFWVESAEVANEVFELRSTGMYGSARVTLGVVARRQSGNLSGLGFFSDEDLGIPPNSLLDSYDSTVGTYGEHVALGTNDQAVIGSNANISVASGSTVLGDMEHGEYSSASLASGAVVTGTISPQVFQQPLPPVAVPPYPQAAGENVGSGELFVLPPGDHGLTDVHVTKGGHFVITGPATVVLDTLDLAVGAQFTLDNSGGPIDLFVEEEIYMGPGSIATTVSDQPDMANIQLATVGSGNATFGSQADFYGRIYAPEADVKILPDFEVFGSVIANSLVISSQARLHFDLGSVPPDAAELPHLWSWRELAVPDGLARFGGDPFQLLGVDAAQMPSPSEAHADQLLELDYVNAAGSIESYSGQEHDFDWSDVDAVLFGARDGLQFAGFPGEDEDTGSGDPSEDPYKAWLSLIQSPLSSADLAAKLLDAYPVDDSVLLATINRVPPMDSSDLYDVMAVYGPLAAAFPAGQGTEALPSSLLLALIQQKEFESSHLGWALVQNSPLDPSVLAAAIARTPAMKISDLNKVLGAQ